jgi:chaperonin cofactor prefoldin
MISPEITELLKFGAIILAGGYAIWRIEMQSKMNKAMIEKFDEKHSIFLENSTSLFKKELEAIEERLKNKKEELEKVKKELDKKYGEIRDEIETMKQNCQNKHSDCQAKMSRFIEFKVADDRYVSKTELQLEMQKIQNKLDMLISYFQGKGHDGLGKINDKH